MREARPIVKASAPTRLDFAGGWTDVAPFTLRQCGAVVNAAISLRVHAEFQPGVFGVDGRTPALATDHHSIPGIRS